MFVGSEGTLGIVTKLYLKLLPKPESSASVLVGYPSLDAALSSMSKVFTAGILPCAVLDATTAEALTANELSLQGSEKHTKAERTAFPAAALKARGLDIDTAVYTVEALEQRLLALRGPAQKGRVRRRGEKGVSIVGLP